MRILLFVHRFHLPGTPGASRHYQLARHWARAGHLVTVLASEDVARPEETAPDPGRLVARRDVEGVRVLRVLTSRSVRGETRRPRLDAASYALTATIASLFRGSSPDLVYAAIPPATAGLAALLAATARRVPFVLEIRDPRTTLRGAARRWLFRGLASRAGRLVTTSDTEARALGRMNVPGEDVLVVPDGLDDWMLEAGEIDAPSATGRLRLVYCGPYGADSGVGQVLDAAILLGPAAPVEFVFVGAGDDAASLEERASGHRPAPCSFLPRLGKTELFEEIRRAGAGLVSVSARTDLERPVPAALYDVMAAGRFVLLVGDGEAARLVREARCGAVVPPGRPSLLADAVLRLAATGEGERRALGANARRWLIDGGSYRDRAWRLLRLFEELTGKKAEDPGEAAVPRLVEENRP